MLEIKNISAGYQNGKPILENFSLDIQAGERVGIVGQNGCGKSTLAKAIMGIVPFVEGEINWKGSNIARTNTSSMLDKGIGYCMQGGRIFSNLSVKENIQFAIINQKNITFDGALSSLKNYNVKLLQTEQRLRLPAGNLSGGEKHILSIIMTIVSNPNIELLIADEPSAGVAPIVQKDILQLINQYLNEKKASLLLIEQNKNFLTQLANKVINITKE